MVLFVARKSKSILQPIHGYFFYPIIHGLRVSEICMFLILYSKIPTELVFNFINILWKQHKRPIFQTRIILWIWPKRYPFPLYTNICSPWTIFHWDHIHNVQGIIKLYPLWGQEFELNALVIYEILEYSFALPHLQFRYVYNLISLWFVVLEDTPKVLLMIRVANGDKANCSSINWCSIWY
jgi:hypothetical protein